MDLLAGPQCSLHLLEPGYIFWTY